MGKPQALGDTETLLQCLHAPKMPSSPTSTTSPGTKQRRVNAEAVFLAAAALAAGGHKPTNEAVRARLGYGSFSTIAPLLKRWRHLQSTPLLHQQLGAANGSSCPRFEAAVTTLMRLQACHAAPCR